METFYFTLGILSIIAIIFIVALVWGLVKVVRTKKDLEDFLKELNDPLLIGKLKDRDNFRTLRGKIRLQELFWRGNMNIL